MPAMMAGIVVFGGGMPMSPRVAVIALCVASSSASTWVHMAPGASKVSNIEKSSSWL